MIGILEVAEKIDGHDLSLLVAGSTVTVLASDLHRRRYQVIDFGQMQKGYARLMQSYKVYEHKIISEKEYNIEINDKRNAE